MTNEIVKQEIPAETVYQEEFHKNDIWDDSTEATRFDGEYKCNQCDYRAP